MHTTVYCQFYKLIQNDLGVQFAIQLDEVSFQPTPWDVDANTTDVVLGGYAGMVRALAPKDALCRQVVRDPQGQLVAWLREKLAATAWEKTCFNSSKGGLDQRIFLQDCLIEHNSSNGGRQW